MITARDIDFLRQVIADHPSRTEFGATASGVLRPLHWTAARKISEVWKLCRDGGSKIEIARGFYIGRTSVRHILSAKNSK